MSCCPSKVNKSHSLTLLSARLPSQLSLPAGRTRLSVGESAPCPALPPRHLALAHILLFHLTSLRDVLGGEPKTLHEIGSVGWGNLESVESVTRPSTKTTGEEGKQCDARHESRSCPPAPVSPDSTSDNIVSRVATIPILRTGTEKN